MNKYKLKATYNNGLQFKFIPYSNSNFSCLTPKNDENPLNKISKNDIIVDNKGELLEVLAYSGHVLRVYNGVNSYNIHINDVKEVYNE